MAKRQGIALKGEYEITLADGTRGTIQGRCRIKIDPKKMRLRPLAARIKRRRK